MCIILKRERIYGEHLEMSPKRFGEFKGKNLYNLREGICKLYLHFWSQIKEAIEIEDFIESRLSK